MQPNIEMSSKQPPPFPDDDDWDYVSPPLTVVASYKCYPVQSDEAATYRERVEMGDCDFL